MDVVGERFGRHNGGRDNRLLFCNRFGSRRFGNRRRAMLDVLHRRASQSFAEAHRLVEPVVLLRGEGLLGEADLLVGIAIGRAEAG